MLIKSIPQSDATNPYDLLMDVKQAILEEPKRVNMGYFCLTSQIIRGKNQARLKDGEEPMPLPSCGTVGCFAGWVGILGGKKPEGISVFNGSEIARRILGDDLKYNIPATQPGYQYSGFEVFNSGDGDGINRLTVGTRAYARAVCRRIDAFIQANGGKAALKKRSIVRAS